MLRVIRRRANVDGFFPNELKSFLRTHRKIDRRLVHVQDETPVTISTADYDAHELLQLWPGVAVTCAHPLDMQKNGHA